MESDSTQAPGASGLIDWHVDLYYDDQWNEITEDVLVTDSLQISRGRSDYESDIPPSEANFVLKNTDGKYSPKNPLSPLYGKIGRNQPTRVRVGEPDIAARFDGRDGSYLHTTGDSATQLVNDFQVIVDIEPETWFPEEEQIVAQSRTDNTYWGWAIFLRPNGSIGFALWTQAGGGPIVTLNHEDFASWGSRRSFECSFWLDADSGLQSLGIWSHDSLDSADTDDPLGRVWNPEPGDVYPPTDGFVLGSDPDGLNAFGAAGFRGRIHGFRFASVSGSHNNATPILRMAVPDTPSNTFVDGTGYTWFVGPDAGVEDRSSRFTGEVNAWPARWGQPDGADAHVPVTAYSIRKRLGRTVEPLKSSFRRMSLNAGPASRTLAYWPLEDGEGSLHFASEVGDYPMVFGNIPGYHVRDIDLAANNDFVASDALPEFHITAATGRVAKSEPTGEYRLLALVKLPDEGVPRIDETTPAEVDLLTLHMTGTISEWTIQVSSDGTLRFKRVRASDGAIGYTDWGTVPTGWGSERYTVYNGRNLVLGMWLRQNGSDVDYQWTAWWGESDAIAAPDYNRSGTDLGYPTDVTVGTEGDLGGTVVGHVTLWNQDTNDGEILFNSIPHALRGNSPETATERVTRILQEENLPVYLESSPVESEPVGVQQTGSPFDILEEAAAADMSIFADRRESRSLYYRPRGGLYNQDPVILDYEQGHVIAPFDPTDDDSYISNDVTVKREGGSSFRAVETTGPLSVNDSPEGIGRYDESVTLNLAYDTQLHHQAGWRLHMGTVDEVYYPTLTVSLHDSPELAERLLPVDVGDRIQVHNLPKWVPPNMADLIVQGYTENSDGINWTITFNCTPASIWSVGVADDAVYGRADTAGSEVLYAVDETAQTLPVLTTVGPRWIEEDEGSFPFDVSLGGETVTVNRIIPLLSDRFIRDDAGIWDDPGRGVWDETFVWSS